MAMADPLTEFREQVGFYFGEAIQNGSFEGIESNKPPYNDGGYPDRTCYSHLWPLLCGHRQWTGQGRPLCRTASKNGRFSGPTN